MPRLVCISDTHGHTDFDVPDGDVLVHAGDLTRRGTLEQVRRGIDWLRSLPHEHKVLVAGNHDFAFQADPAAARALTRGLDYLEDSGATVLGLRFWGSPWQPWFHDWAFNLERGPALREKWDLIPSTTDVLVVHGPPRGHGDLVWNGTRVGCADLFDAVRRVRPRLVACGHIHEDAGRFDIDGTLVANASICDRRYDPVQPAIVVDLEPA